MGPCGVRGRRSYGNLRLPYSVQALPEDQLPEGAHRPGGCPDPENKCLLCWVFGSLNHASLFKNYTPPLVDDPRHKLEVPQEVNHVLIRPPAMSTAPMGTPSISTSSISRASSSLTSPFPMDSLIRWRWGFSSIAWNSVWMWARRRLGGRGKCSSSPTRWRRSKSPIRGNGTEKLSS